jgi:hypothetical protein
VKRLALSLAVMFAAISAPAADGEDYVTRLVTDGHGTWHRVYVPVRAEFVYLRSDAWLYRLHDENTREGLSLSTPGWTVYDTRTGTLKAEKSMPTPGPAP